MNYLARQILTIVALLCLYTPAMAQSALNKKERTAIASTLQSITLPEVAGSYVKVDEVRIRSGKVEVKASAELAYYPMRHESPSAYTTACATPYPRSFATISS